MSKLFKPEQFFYTKEYFEKKPPTPEEETLTEQLNLRPSETDPSGEEKKDEFVPGRFVASEALEGAIVGLFFSAMWSPPCVQFVPLLREMYDELKKRKSNFEVVFVSFDHSAEEMEKYFREKHGDWYTIPFGEPVIEELKEKYNITAIPRLIVVQKDGEIVTAKGRKEIQDKGVICFRNWTQTTTVLDAKMAQIAEDTAEAADTENKTANNNNNETKAEENKGKVA